VCVCESKSGKLDKFRDLVPIVALRGGHANECLAGRQGFMFRGEGVSGHALIGRTAGNNPSGLRYGRHSVLGQELRAARRPTEKNLHHENPIGEKKFTKSENSFKTSHKPRKYKGLPSHGKAGSQANEPDHRPNNGS